ncbi:MAG: GIY-YIG nuclease family protein [Ginsengibacter sp.]|jgi:putative endonuclease
MKTYYVYILLCSDNSYYTGVTNNINRRIGEHVDSFGQNTYVSKRLPAILVYCEATHDVNQAIGAEKQIKGWSRKKKEALIKGDWELLKELSVSYGKRKEKEKSDVEACGKKMIK